MSYLENLKKKRKEENVQPRLLSSKSKSDIIFIHSLKEKEEFRIVQHEQDEFPYFKLYTSKLEVEETIDKCSIFNLKNLIKEDVKLGKKLGVDSKTEDEELRKILIDYFGKDHIILVKKSIFISRVHGNPEIPDVIEEYIKFADKLIKDISQDENDRRERLKFITGFKDKNKDYHAGIMPSDEQVCYAKKSDGSIVRLQMYKNVMNEIEKCICQLDDPESPFMTDPFSDPETGIPLVFDKDEKGKPTVCEKKIPKNFKGSPYDFSKQFALTDEEIENINSKPSLTSLFVNVYKARDFELAVNGLKIFDEKHEFNVFENSDFIEIVEQISEYYLSNQENEEEQPKPDTKKENKASKKDDLDILNQKPGKVTSNPKKDSFPPKNWERSDDNDSQDSEEEEETSPTVSNWRSRTRR